MMELLVWVTQWVIPLLGWWILTAQFQKLALRLRKTWIWNQDFKSDFFRSFLLAFCHATPEHHLQTLKLSPLSLRLRLLWLSLRSLGYGFIFLMLFGVWNFVPVSVLLLLGLILFVIAQWWKPSWEVALFVMGAGLFIFGFEELLRSASQWRSNIDEFNWIFHLSNNFLVGALIGALLGALIRVIFRISGVAMWSGVNLLLAGVLSLGGAWGFFVGEFLVSVAEDLFRHREKDFRWRCRLSLIFGIVMLLLTTPFQHLMLTWINGEFSVQLRSLQLAAMIFTFLFLESVLSLIFFHFYYLKKSESDLRR